VNEINQILFGVKEPSLNTSIMQTPKQLAEEDSVSEKPEPVNKKDKAPSDDFLDW
jgi:hypothetical protein